MKAVVAAFNQEKALVGAFSVIRNLRMELLEALIYTVTGVIRFWRLAAAAIVLLSHYQQFSCYQSAGVLPTAKHNLQTTEEKLPGKH